MQLAKRAADHVRSAEQGPWLSRLHDHRDDFRAVLAWSAEQDLPRGIELATTLGEPWEMHGQLEELVAWLERALATPGATDTRTRAIGLKTYGEGLLYIEQPVRAHEPLEESLVLFQELGDRLGQASVLQVLDMAAWVQGDNEPSGRGRSALPNAQVQQPPADNGTSASIEKVAPMSSDCRS